MAARQKKLSTALDIGSLIADKKNKFSSLYHHALELIRLQQILKDAIQRPLGDHITVANVVNNILTIYTDSAAWAARLRFSIPEMLDSLDKKAPDLSIKSIRIKVMPTDNPGTETGYKPALSEKNSLLLKNVADSISDAELREALLRLSRNR